MRIGFVAFLTVISAHLAALAANEGVPSYYQTSSSNANKAMYGEYANQGYTKYVGQSGQKQVVGTNTYTYQVARPVVPTQISAGAMTPNGIAIPVEDEKRTNIYAAYSRRFADFQFETGVNSVLEWDDMIFNEVTVGARHNFSLGKFDMFAMAEYTYGRMESGGLSMDYDLAPFDWADPYYGIFTISIGSQSGYSNHLRLGIGARHIWDIGGWKLSPSIGYEIFQHKLEMADHIYPNPGMYIPLMTAEGLYIYGAIINGEQHFLAAGQDEVVGDGWYQVCMSADMMKAWTGISGPGYLGTTLPGELGDYQDSWGYLPWGVYGDECVVIGGDGPIVVSGTTHIYDTTWSGFYVGLEVEKQMTLKDSLRFYVQFSLPKYSAEGTWPNRTDWQQNPSFLDEGTNGAYAYAAEIEYNYQLSSRLKLSLKADMNYFHIGEIGGELYVAGYSDFEYDANGVPVEDDYGYPIIVNYPPYTEKVTNSLKSAVWQSFGLHLGLKFAF